MLLPPYRLSTEVREDLTLETIPEVSPHTEPRKSSDTISKAILLHQLNDIEQSATEELFESQQEDEFCLRTLKLLRERARVSLNVSLPHCNTDESELLRFKGKA